MDKRNISMIAVALYGVALVIGFVFISGRAGVIIAVIGAILLSIVYRAVRPAADGPGRQRNRNRSRNRR